MAYRAAMNQVPNLRLYVATDEAGDLMPYFYNASDVLLLTSRHEGSNNSVKEAMACDRPVVTTDAGDVCDLSADASPSRVCPRSTEQLAKALATVIRHGTGPDSRSRIQRLSLENVADRVVSLYESLLSSSASQH